MVEIYRTKNSMELHVQIFIDPDNRRIHVLDQDAEGTMSVTNGIDQIQQEILEKHRLDGEINDWQWVLYGTDGVVSVFEQGQFKIAPGGILHWPFFEVCYERHRRLIKSLQ